LAILDVIQTVDPGVCAGCFGDPAGIYTTGGGSLKIVFNTAIPQPTITLRDLNGRLLPGVPTTPVGTAPTTEWVITPIPSGLKCFNVDVFAGVGSQSASYLHARIC
jgi:hypothetical protein